MKKLIIILLFICSVVQAGQADSTRKRSKFDFTGSRDPSLIRGFNYTPANAVSPHHHIDTWVKYDSTRIEFDLDLAKSLKLNQVRVFVPYEAYVEDKEGLPLKLRHFVQE